jgi:hypothetical protein
VREYVGDIEAAVAAAARGVLDQGLATLTRTESGAKLLPRSPSACSLEIAELYGFRGPDRRPEALGPFLGKSGWLYPSGTLRLQTTKLFDERWLEFRNDFVSRYVPPVLDGLVENERLCAEPTESFFKLERTSPQRGCRDVHRIQPVGRAATAKDADTTPLWALRALTHCAAA